MPELPHSSPARTDEAVIIRNAALASMLRGERLENALELIAMSAEFEVPGVRCAILLTDTRGELLQVGGAPSLPDDARTMLEYIPISEAGGVCGVAASRRAEVFVEDIFDNPLSVGFREFARAAGVAASWAEPLLDSAGALIGVFAGYQPSTGRLPEPAREAIRQASQLAALVISHYRQADNLQASQATFRGIFDTVSDALLVLDADGRILDANGSASLTFDRPHDELLGLTAYRLAAHALNDPVRVRAAYAAALAGEAQQLEFWGEKAGGEILLAECRLGPTNFLGQQAVLASIVDITEAHAARQRLEIERDLAAALSADGTEREALLATMLDLSLRFPEFDCGAIFWQTPEGGYRLQVERGLSPEIIAQRGYRPPDAPDTLAITSGQVICSSTDADPHCTHDLLPRSPDLLAEGFRCLVIIPVVVDGQTLACIDLAGRRTGRISDSTFQAALNLASHFAQALSRLNAQLHTRQLQQNLSGLFDALNDFLIVIDLQGRIVHHNRAVTLLLGHAPGSLIGKPVADLHPGTSHDTVTTLVADMLAGRRTSCPLPIQRADGSELVVETRVVSGHWNGQPVLFGISQDITERLHTEARLRLAASVFEHAHEGIMITDARGTIVEINQTFSELTGYTREEAVGSNAGILQSGRHDAGFYNRMWQAIREHGFWRGEVWNRKKSGEIFVELLTISAVPDQDGRPNQFVGIFSDITQQKQHQQRLEHLAHFDALTQLPNRIMLADRMQLAMAQAMRSHQMVALCYLDLDGFKPINDRFGHSAGDSLLIEVGRRLKHCIRGGDTVSRLGGDEFVLLLGGITDLQECERAAMRVLDTLATPFTVDSHLVTISASIGITVYPNDSSDSDTLLRHADQAMYSAKQAGRNRYHLFDMESDRQARLRRNELERIRAGLADGEFLLHYQPKVNMRAGVVLGAEALIRWQHPERGLLYPGEFLPYVEGSDVDVEMGHWVIGEALRQIAAWRASGLELVVSVNVSGAQLQAPAFVERLTGQLAEQPTVPPHCLEIEILETAALDDIATASTIFTACRELGIAFALDDFGTGYSSLTYFRRLPAETLKIDQSFVRDMLDDPEDFAIVEGVVGLTRAFNRKVIAEGVETPEHGLALLRLGCDMAQGYGIARPMPAAALPEWVARFQPHPLWREADTHASA